MASAEGQESRRISRRLRRDYSYGGFYEGFGLYISVYLLFSAILAWQLGNIAAASPHVIGMIGWTFFGVQVVGLALSCIYFARL